MKETPTNILLLNKYQGSEDLCNTAMLVYLLMNSVIAIQITQSKTNVVPMFLDVLCRTAHTPVHADVV